MTTLHQLTDNCLAVAGLPIDTSFKCDGRFLYYNLNKDFPDFEKFPTGNWRILGKANELTEEQWKEVVEFHKLDHGKLFFNYVGDDFLNTATESGASLLKLHQLENPLILIKE